MKKLLSASIVLLVLAFAFTASAVEKLYFADIGNDKILRCDLDGSNMEELVTTDLEAVGCIAIDRTGGKMYWTDWPSSTAHIKRANLDGSGVETILSGLDGPWGIALDVPNGKMYWTEFSGEKIRRANLDGSNIEDLVTTGLSHTVGIALDLGSGKMYWADGATQYYAKIQRANLDGSDVETLIEDPLVAPHGLALDLNAGKMYFTDIGTDTLYRANLDGSSLEELLPSEYGTMPCLALDLEAAKIYFSDYGGPDSKIKKANLDGTGVTDVISSGIGSAYGLAFGPAVAECSSASLEGSWLVLVTGVEVYDYAIYMIFDGAGTIDEMGAFNVPDSAGSYSIDPDCDMTGYIWSDGYVPFTGHVHSDTLAEVDIGSGPMDLIKVTDVGALEGCWMGHFLEDSTGLWSNVTLDIDEFGSIVSSTGFPAPVSGRIFTDSGYLAGYFVETGPTPGDEYMFLDASAVGDSVLSGTYGKDCEEDCPGGSFHLRRCTTTGVQDRTPAGSSVTISNYPNPFNPQTTIAYSLSETGWASIRVYDAAGRFVITLVSERKRAGMHTTIWNGRDHNGAEVSSGVYFVRFESAGGIGTRRIVLIK